MALGAQVRIENMPGYLRILNDPQLCALFKANGVALVGEEAFTGPLDKIEGVSGDIGDVGHIMPALISFYPGWSGHAHTAGYLIEDEEIAYILPAKAMAMTVVDLLWDEAETARSVLQEHVPLLTKDQYLSLLRSLFNESQFPV